MPPERWADLPSELVQRVGGLLSSDERRGCAAISTHLIHRPARRREGASGRPFACGSAYCLLPHN